MPALCLLGGNGTVKGNAAVTASPAANAAARGALSFEESARRIADNAR